MEKTWHERLQEEQEEKTLFYSSFFYRGWRPLVGWVSVFGLFIVFIIYPLADLILSITGSSITLGSLSSESIIAMVGTALTSIAVRTHEKINSRWVKK